MFYLIIFLVLIFLLCLWWFVNYFSLIITRNLTYKKFLLVDFQLKKRYELISEILSMVQNHIGQEQSLFENITRLRMELLDLNDDYINIDRKINLNKELIRKMNQLFLFIENNPQFTYDQSILQAVQKYNNNEEKVKEKAKIYNSSAHNLRNAVEIFPKSFLARLNNIKSLDLFWID